MGDCNDRAESMTTREFLDCQDTCARKGRIGRYLKKSPKDEARTKDETPLEDY